MYKAKFVLLGLFSAILLYSGSNNTDMAQYYTNIAKNELYYMSDAEKEDVYGGLKAFGLNNTEYDEQYIDGIIDEIKCG